MNHRLTGGCHCGTVRYEVDPVGGQADYCHCRACRKSSGGIVVAWLQVRPDRFALTAGAPVGYASSPGAIRWRCPRCGAITHMTDDDNRSVGVTIGTLDDPDPVAPSAHGFDGERPRWLVIADDLPRFDGPPPYDRG
jgi:hypothetical protein